MKHSECDDRRGEEVREGASLVVAHVAASLQRPATIAGAGESFLLTVQIVMRAGQIKL